ncbi:ComEC/Rec2 family competence protein [Roseateles sp. LYH14W]|uniref:ComEC/Rec2 family competence protein n=1 Tax=Pelomonas parva TaxID=3299032 RepID=A0ABW7F5Z5_9BURK
MAGACSRAHAEVGQPLAPWTPGGLDIHHIATGRGNATLAILPDGASLLIDAGAMLSELDVTVAPRPSAERRAGEWIARYVQRHVKATGRDGLDSLLVTHLHPDHLGDVRASSPPSTRGPYRLSGVTDVADALRVGRLVDRGYPSYDDPAIGIEQADFFRNYRAFVESWVARGGRAERFVVGSATQLGTGVRNIAANGRVWTGQGEDARALFPPLASLPPGDRPTENMCSAGVRISSGPFSYFTGGDLTNEGADGELPWRDVLTAAARACGPVDVATADHHGLYDGLNPAVVRALRPQAWVVQAWHVSHPSPQQLDHMLNERFYPGRREVYATHLMRENLLVNRRLALKMRSHEGHVVVRVAPGGESFRVIVTDNGDESDRVRAVSDVFRSRSLRS